MDSRLKSLLHFIALFITWLVFVPLYIYLSFRWKISKIGTRIFFTVISPCTIILLIVLLWCGYDQYYYNVYRGSMSEIEKKTQIDFPDYKTIKPRQESGDESWRPPKRTFLFNDFSMGYTIQLDSTEINSFYQKIENQIIKNRKIKRSKDEEIKTYWSKGDGIYSFSDFGGDGSSETLSLCINTKNRMMEIKYGCY